MPLDNNLEIIQKKNKFRNTMHANFLVSFSHLVLQWHNCEIAYFITNESRTKLDSMVIKHLIIFPSLIKVRFAV